MKIAKSFLTLMLLISPLFVLAETNSNAFYGKWEIVGNVPFEMCPSAIKITADADGQIAVSYKVGNKIQQGYNAYISGNSLYFESSRQEEEGSWYLQNGEIREGHRASRLPRNFNTEIMYQLFRVELVNAESVRLYQTLRKSYIGSETHTQDYNERFFAEYSNW